MSNAAAGRGGSSSDWLPRAEVTSSGRPILRRGEVEKAVIPAVDLKPEEEQGASRRRNPSSSLSPLTSGRLHLTTHRLVWIDDRGEPSSASAFTIHLSSILSATPFRKHSLANLFHAPRVRLHVSPGSGASVLVVSLILRRRGDDLSESFFGRLTEVLRQRSWVEEADEVSETSGSSWEVTASASASGEGARSTPAPPRISMPVVGIAGILRREQEAWESTDRSLQEAFQDLNALMSKAKEMVMLAEKMRQSLLSGPSNNVNSGNEMGSKQEMQDWLLSVGIASPVTKESAGTLYHQQLSRELADFVKVPLERNGGMIALIDIYCLYNRARGAALISPDDLLQACAIWKKVDVSVMLRRFDSGVMAIQSKNHRDEMVFSRINALVLKPEALEKGISPSDASMTLGIAPTLAKEQLLAAESKGLLCRDVSPDGFRFYANIFQEIDPRDMYRINNNGVFSMWATAVS